MENQLIAKLAQLRYLVGFLGEKTQHNWWSSNFLTPSTKKMLEFTFPRTAHLAQYEAVSAAAARIHDDSIGVGKSFHLFRLPEYLEKALVDKIQSAQAEDFESLLVSKDKALAELSEIIGSASLTGEGPISLGQVKASQWEQSIAQMASAYFQAFNNGTKSFPYFQSDV
ncbi:BrxE family protein [Neiella marina]|uniref:BrxE family protein n=1 Tax=Neiella holothuriorum TaxID=2870530 RepID=A0ABS7EGG7_9GAMM|nr:BrxE family protein [Neiella holothuriorum]MBW8191431.1 BrxE family protein [Neiella holothuriorum]